LPDPAALVRPEDVPDSVHAPDSALRDLAASVRGLAQAALLLRARRPVRNGLHRIALAVADSNIRRLRKAQ
jgi:hypothetical protein